MKILKLVLFVWLILFSQKIVTQNKKVDSLRSLINLQKKDKKIKTLLEISTIYSGINLDSAKKYTEKAYLISKKIKNDSLTILALASLGFRNFESGDYKKAIGYFEKALPISLKIKDTTSIADIYNGFAIVYSKQGNLSKSIEYNFKTLSIYEQIKDSLGIGNSYLNIGWDYKKLKEFEKSLKYNLKSLKIYQDIKDSLRIAMVNNNIAGTHNELGNYKKAINYSNKSKEYFLKLNFNRYTAYPISVMAVAYDSLKNYVLAEKNYLNAIKLHTENREPYELAFLNYSIANLYYKQSKFNDALFNAKEAMNFAQEVDSKEYIADISGLMSKIYEKKDNVKLSNKYLKLLLKYNDSILNNEKIKSIAEIETKYQTAKKEAEIAQQKEQLLENQLAIKNRNFYAILLASALLILAIISFAIYKRNQFKRKQLQKEIDLKDALAIIKTQNTLQEQRLRISRDLHDNIGSQLTFIISSLDNLKFISKDVNEALKNKITNISSFTSETIHQLRDTIWAMNKSEISMEDLHSRILSFIEKAKIATSGIEFEINQNINKEISLSSLKGMNVFRVIQEAINNAIKYAEATKIAITIEEIDNKISITVTDNGKGFDINATVLGNGLSNMETRMSEINGSVFINSKIKNGTEIIFRI